MTEHQVDVANVDAVRQEEAGAFVTQVVTTEARLGANRRSIGIVSPTLNGSIERANLQA